jgi:hypothetical protein
MAKKRIKSTAKMARGYEPGDFTFERSSRLGAVRGGEGTTTVVRVGGDSSPDAPAPALGSLASEDDAPFDGVAYERKDGEWVAAGAVLTDGDKGDITVSASGATWTIDDEAVTYAKIQEVRAERLLGNPNGGDGAVEEIPLGSGIAFVAGDLACTIAEQPSLVRVLDADASLSTSGAQPWFPSNGAVTLEGSTAYMFRGVLYFDATAVAVSVLFGGTATTGSITYNFVGQRIAAGSSGVTQSSGWQTGTTLSTTAVAATNSTTGNGWIMVEGIVRVTSAGTLIPQLSIASGGGTAYRNSWFALWKLGANTITTKGTWS